MKVGGQQYRSIWLADDNCSVEIIDQTKLPHAFVVAQLSSAEDAAQAISTMMVRGAPLIGATAAYGICLALRQDTSTRALDAARERLLKTRPTAINLRWALDSICDVVGNTSEDRRVEVAYGYAASLCDQDVAANRSIGEYGAELLVKLWSDRKDGSSSDPVNVLTHCNAGSLATVDWGTALAPVYVAHDEGIPVHVWVDETRPRNQGSALTAWELGSHGVPFTVIVDNAGGHLMQSGQVDICITGTDRTVRNGDVANKIGTYLKAVAAQHNKIPFYVALPSSTIDWSSEDRNAIPIEERSATEVTHISGRSADGSIQTIQLTPDGTVVKNFAFDVTPSDLVTGLITERGICTASEQGLLALFPEHV